MKKNILKIAATSCILLLTQRTFSQNTFPASGSAGIGITSPNASALLDVTSSSQGILIPRMTFTQRNLITSPATGLLIYQTNSTPGFYYYSGTAWSAIKGSPAGKTLNNLTSPTAINVSLLPGVDNSSDLGSAAGSWKDLYVDGRIFLNDSSFIGGGATNLFAGKNAGLTNTTGTNNVALGPDALRLNDITNGNVAIGSAALYNKIGSSGNNVAVGLNSMFTTTTGSLNVAIGSNALYSNTNASRNTAVGANSLIINNTGSDNTAVGYNSISNNTTGSYNSALGRFTLNNNSSGYHNVAVGNSALFSNTTANSNVAVGAAALYKNSTRGNLVAVGDSALYNNGIGAISSSDATENTAVGSKALYTNSTGAFNTAVGSGAMLLNNNGSSNTAIGNAALNNNSNGASNTAVGVHALFLSNNSQNTAIGNAALATTSSGNDNTAIGYGACLANTTGSYNTCIGSEANVSSGSLSTATAIGRGSIVNASNKMQLGSSTTILATTGGITIVSDGRFKDNVKTEDVPGLDFITKLKPVTYNFSYKRYDDFLKKDVKNIVINDAYQKELIEKGKKREVGFIAQEVNETVNQNHFTFNGVYTPQNENDNYAIDYSRIVVPLVKSVQELSAQNNELKKAMAQMQEQINVLSGNTQKAASEKTTVGAQIKITPNPAHDVANITILSNDKMQTLVVKVIDASGKVVRTFNTETVSSVFEFSTSAFSKGTYMVQLFNQSELVSIEKLIVQ